MKIDRRSILAWLNSFLLNETKISRLNRLASEFLRPQKSERMIGVAYQTWFTSKDWVHPDPCGGTGFTAWGHPLLGQYKSDDPAVIERHAIWLADAGVDFIFVDWSNEIDADLMTMTGPPLELFVEQATMKIFEVYSKIKKAPKISIFIGHQLSGFYNGKLKRKADEIYQTFVLNPLFEPLIQRYLEKPLLVIYVNTPSPFQSGLPPFADDRFTVRFMTGYASSQNLTRFGYWSWEDRGSPAYTVFDGHPETMTLVASWRNSNSAPSAAIPWEGNPGRDGGRTFLASWKHARMIRPQIILITTFNEWKTGEQPSLGLSKDIEPSEELGFLYLEILKEQGSLFKKGI